MGVWGQRPQKKKWQFFCIHFWVVFQHMVFADGFLFPVKELGLLINPGYWMLLDRYWIVDKERMIINWSYLQ
jgi:hypothetical protein